MKAWVIKNKKQQRSKKREEKQPQQPLPLSPPPITTTPNHQNHKPKPTSASPPSTKKRKTKTKINRTHEAHRSTYQTTINPIGPLKHTLNHRKSVRNPIKREEREVAPKPIKQHYLCLISSYSQLLKMAVYYS